VSSLVYNALLTRLIGPPINRLLLARLLVNAVALVAVGSIGAVFSLGGVRLRVASPELVRVHVCSLGS
jgi:hypothetical protein